MAVPTVVGVGAQNGGPGAGPVTIAFPTGVAADDICILAAEANEADVYNVPSGWAHVTGSPVVVSTGGTRLAVMWRRFVAGDSAPALSLGTGTDHILARMVAVRGCKTSGNPWNAVATTTEVTSDTSATWPGTTTTVNDCLVLEIIAAGLPDAVSTTNLGALTNGSYTNIVEQMDNWVAAGSGGGVGMVSATMSTAGATGASTATLATAAPKALMTLALEPPASGGVSGLMAVTGGGAVVAQGRKDALGGSSVSVSGDLTAQGRKDALGTAAVSGGGQVTMVGAGSGAPAAAGTMAVTGGGTVSVTGSRAASGAMSVTGGGTVAITGLIPGRRWLFSTDTRWLRT